MTQDKIITSDIPQPRNAWDTLSMKEKAEMIGVAVRNGITSLKDIKQKYNEFAEGGDANPYTVGATVDALYASNPREEFLGEPLHHYDFTQSEEWANAHGYYPDARGHRDDRVKKPAHPSHPSRGTWNGDKFELTDLGMQNPNYTLFGLTDGGQDPQAVLTYQGGIVLPEVTVTPNENYFYNPYDNIILHQKANGGKIYIKPSHRGRLTELKKRTGKTEAELYNDGNPAHKKMVVFARNARRWKHGLGGNLFLTGGPTQDDYPEGYWENRREHAEVKPRYIRTKKDDEYWKAKQKSTDRAAEDLNRKKGIIMSALEEQAGSVPFTGESYKQATDNQRQKALDKANDLKKGLKATITAAELGLSGASLLGAYANWRNWATAANLTKRGIANLLQKAQAPMQEAGALIDGYQTIDAYENNDFDTYYNGASGILGVAGTIGASDIFRGRYPMVDRFLDTSGIIQNAGDFIKFGYDTLSNKAE